MAGWSVRTESVQILKLSTKSHLFFPTHLSPSPNLPLWNGPRKTSSKGPSVWQIKDALESMSTIPSLPDSELLICLGEKKKNE